MINVYKVIFADDEAIMRERIASLIDWNKVGFDLVASASNGDELIDAVTEHKPDLVISDINMPFVDGVTAGREIRRLFPNIKLIFLTGYNELSYVHEAINLKVFKYLLKPLTPDSLYENLTKVKFSLDEEITNLRSQTKLKNYFDSSFSMTRALYIKSLIKDFEEVQYNDEILEVLSLKHLKDAAFVISMIGMYEGSLDKPLNPHDSDTKNVLNITMEALGEEDAGYVVLDNDKILILHCLNSNVSIENEIEKVELVLEEIRANVKNLFGIEVFIGVGCYAAEMNLLKNSYRSATTALQYAESNQLFAIVNEKDIHIQGIPSVSANPFLPFVEEINYYSTKVLTEKLDILPTVISDADIETLKVYYVDAIVQLIKKANVFEIDNKELVRAISDFQKEAFYEKADVWEAFKLEIFLFKNRLDTSNQGNSQLVFKNALRFVEEHYQNPEIGIKDVCESIHLSESYFRSIFKQEAGTTFGSYLISYRMKKAKHLVLTTNMKNYQIAEEVGYVDPHYFSYCFKKYYKESPKRYRELKSDLRDLETDGVS